MNETREIQARLTKCMLELVVLQLLNERTMHGYEVIKQVRKEYGVYFGPSTIYPLLNTLEKKKLIKGEWEMHGGRPRKVYQLTDYGNNQLLISIKTLAHLNLTITTQKENSTIHETVENIPSTPA
jgi:DNA-binding PadR family transcriptional regulator